MKARFSLDLFCRVVDNYGDIGVCWRLARQLVREHQLAVTLWVDDLASFQRLCAQVDPAAACQQIEGVAVRHWNGAAFAAYVCPDVVIEAFACDLPEAVLAAMLAAPRPPLWLNLEYLSAEAWVEDCHALPSLHPSGKLRKYFFFPGFSARTGGLLCERSLSARRNAFQNDGAARADFLAGLGIRPAPGAHLATLFCYPSAPVGAMLRRLDASATPWHLVVPEGVATAALADFAPQRLAISVLPFVAQHEYDRLLWAADFNFVRGEDSFVRAQWAARPFVWQIYPQEEGVHLVKLAAFLARYGGGSDLVAASAFWNGDGGDADALGRCMHAPELQQHAKDWAESLAKNGDLASNLVEFIGKMG
ncbi:elongation factor P maturation arginine rhamnosyltransferase EarP [Massilia sp. TS11]|uniref:elongation factor P maturation arginine rhamnosyltransferase EarP n=1 Tax=Massilia sp. TS11 TaxID=2908003 RepID=UPI001EDA59EB|nr:elongation factor P maturation arginine rhamnosyltransferase EarP [Massilia sp. TS11]MCG2583344.1 elongation factor P maturation arginine rhamnosyltransferase EarP [Massilia sp. TS11]